MKALMILYIIIGFVLMFIEYFIISERLEYKEPINFKIYHIILFILFLPYTVIFLIMASIIYLLIKLCKIISDTKIWKLLNREIVNLNN